MNILVILALGAILSCIATKWVLTFKILTVRQAQDRHRFACREAKKSLEEARHRGNFLAHAEKQLKARITSASQNLTSLRYQEKDLLVQELEEEAAKAKQRALLKGFMEE